MQSTSTRTIELDKLNKFADFDVKDTTSVRVQARLSSGTPWGGAVLKFYGSVTDDRNQWNELDAAVTISADEGITTVLNTTCIRRLRVKVATASTTVGALVDVSVCAQNPSIL